MSDNKFRVIDMHTHILPRNLPDLTKKYGYGEWVSLEETEKGTVIMKQGGKFFREVEQNCFDIEVRLQEMKNTNVDVQVLCTVPVLFSYWAKPEHALELHMMLNDHIAAICEKYPSKFVGLGCIPMQDPKLACQELRRCVEELGLSGVQIGSHVNNMTLADPKLFPIFETAAELGACILVHPWDMVGQDLMKKYWLPWLVGMPTETTFAICSLIFGGVMEKLPNLRLCFGHGGGSFPYTIGRIEHGFNCRPDLVAVDNKVNPRNYLGKFWVDSIVHDPLAFEYLVKVIGEDKIIMGTDYPFPLGEVPPLAMPGDVITKSKLDPKIKQKMLFDNVVAWLGVSRKRFL